MVTKIKLSKEDIVDIVRNRENVDEENVDEEEGEIKEKEVNIKEAFKSQVFNLKQWFL